MGLGIYWGEGDKSKSVSTVAVSNTGPHLLKKFIEFLNKIYGVKPEKLKYSLIIFNKGSKKKAVNFWTRHLNIKKENLGKITIIPPQGKGTYRKKSLTGVLKVTVYNKKLKNEILKTLAGVV